MSQQSKKENTTKVKGLNGVKWFIDKSKAVLLSIIGAFVIGLVVDMIWLNIRYLKMPLVVKFFIMTFTANLLVETLILWERKTALICKDERSDTRFEPHMVPIIHFGWMMILFHRHFTNDILAYIKYRF